MGHVMKTDNCAISSYNIWLKGPDKASKWTLSLFFFYVIVSDYILAYASRDVVACAHTHINCSVSNVVVGEFIIVVLGSLLTLQGSGEVRAWTPDQSIILPSQIIDGLSHYDYSTTMFTVQLFYLALSSL